MDDSVVLVRTARGRDAAVGILRTQLAPPLRILLAVINGRSALGELRKKLSDQFPVNKLPAAIDELLTLGYVEIARSTAPKDNDLDFTHLSSAESLKWAADKPS